MNNIEFVYIENNRERVGLGHPIDARSAELPGGMVDKKRQKADENGKLHYKIVPLRNVVRLIASIVLSNKGVQ